MVVQSAGKPRPLTKFSYEALLLKPLHKTLYGWLSRRPWLLRGEPTKEALNRAGFVEDAGLLTSGDYRSATDNLPIEVAEVVLEEARRNSVVVPDSVWVYALRMLRPQVHAVLHGVEESFVVTKGQMMGSYLSFPLLCFQNYAAFRWARALSGRKERFPLLINGDDILFQSDPEFSRVWEQAVSSVGLEVEPTKTSRSYDFASLNSTLFRWKSSRLCVQPTIRMGMLRPRDYLNGLGRTFADFVRGVPPGVAWLAGKEFFRWNIAAMRSTGRLTADEWGFRGRLAWRLASIFSIAASSPFRVEPPPCPSEHDVQVPSELLEWFPLGSLSDELRSLNAAEMTCWKWSHEYNRASGAVRYCVALSSLRVPPEPNVSNGSPSELNVRYRFELTPPSATSLKSRFFSDGAVKTERVFRELLRLQDFSDFDQLPPYAEVEMDFVVSNSKPDVKS
jgi:hypothetical protein